MKKCIFFIGLAVVLTVGVSVLWTGCNKPSKVEQYRAEKHVRDSVALVEQQRSLSFYQSQLEALMPKADSLIALFSYEKNDKYQDHGVYVIRNQKLKIKNYELRVMVRDDGQEMMVYRNGKRLTSDQANAIPSAQEAIERAMHLQMVIHDIKELEKRIDKTSLEIQKYEKRLTQS